MLAGHALDVSDAVVPMERLPELSRRGLLASGLVAAGVVVGPGHWTPYTTRVYTTSGNPERREVPERSPVIDGEPSLDAPLPAAAAFVLGSTEEAERRVDWDALLPPRASEPYRTLGPREFTSVVAAVLPAASDLVDSGSYVRDGTVHHAVSVRDRSNALMTSDNDGPRRRYVLDKWTLGWSWQSTPTAAEVRFAERARDSE